MYYNGVPVHVCIYNNLYDVYTYNVYTIIMCRVSRVCEKECEIGGHLIPPGVHIDIPVYYIHHNPDLWEEPEKFNPDR